MACKGCGSKNLQELAGELSASFIDIGRANLSPVYVCQPLLICLDCGFTELVVTKADLELLKKERAASG